MTGFSAPISRRARRPRDSVPPRPARCSWTDRSATHAGGGSPPGSAPRTRHRVAARGRSRCRRPAAPADRRTAHVQRAGAVHGDVAGAASAAGRAGGRGRAARRPAARWRGASRRPTPSSPFSRSAPVTEMPTVRPQHRRLCPPSEQSLCQRHVGDALDDADLLQQALGRCRRRRGRAATIASSVNVPIVRKRSLSRQLPRASATSG